jgi:hypothetical protein
MKLSAQDLMIMRNAKSDTLKVKVILISSEKIKFKYWPVDSSMPSFEELKSRVRKIVFSGGQEIKFYEDDFTDPTNYSSQNKMAIKLAPFSWLLGFTSISFEKNINPGKSYETTLGLIGAGFNNKYFDYPSGAFFKAGYKFINRPDYHMSGMKYMHILKGSYVKPEIIGIYYGNSQNSNEVNVTGLCGMLNIGKQWVYDDAFCVDIFVGMGIGKKNVKIKYNSNSILDYGLGYIPYGFYANPESDANVNLCYAGGIKIGMLFGK